jgi:hypothetical protein
MLLLWSLDNGTQDAYYRRKRKKRKRLKPRVILQGIMRPQIIKKMKKTEKRWIEMMGSLPGSLFLCKEAVQVFDNGK